MSVGVIGAGAWGVNLVRTFFNLGALAGVAETDAATRKKLASQYPGVPLFPDHAALLKAEIPAVVVATPAATHYRLTREALLAGKDVFVEKPLALSLAEARELAELAQSRGRILMAGHLLLYQPAVRWIKNFLSSGGLGRPAYLVQERLKLGRVRAVENVLWSFGVHDVAVLLYLVGETPRRVLAVGRRFLQSGVEDEAHLHLEFASGVQAHLHVSWLWPENRRRLTVVGSEGMLTYDELSREVTLYRKKVGPDLAARDGGQEVVFRGEGEPLLLECRHFLECVEQRRQPLSDGTSALPVVEVLERAQKQLEGGGPWKE